MDPAEVEVGGGSASSDIRACTQLISVGRGKSEKETIRYHQVVSGVEDRVLMLCGDCLQACNNQQTTRWVEK
jgi:hypothetical protein